MFYYMNLENRTAPPEVIQEQRIVCEDIGERTRRISAAQRQLANTRSKRAQEMGRQVAQKKR